MLKNDIDTANDLVKDMMKFLLNSPDSGRLFGNGGGKEQRRRFFSSSEMQFTIAARG